MASSPDLFDLAGEGPAQPARAALAASWAAPTAAGRARSLHAVATAQPPAAAGAAFATVPAPAGRNPRSAAGRRLCPFARRLTCVALAAACALGLCPGAAFANTNAGATAALNAIKQQQYYVPGSACPSGTNVGWLTDGSSNCRHECYAFVNGVVTSLFGANCQLISGVTELGYTATNAGSFNTVGVLNGGQAAGQPSQDSVVALLKQAYPGDVIQFRGGADGWGVPQHTAVVEAVDDGGITVYHHASSQHIVSVRYDWDFLYNWFFDFDASATWDKGISLYHYKDYASVYPDAADLAVGQYYDVKDGEWFASAVTQAAQLGLMTGYGDGMFGPEAGLTRAQAAVVLWRYFAADEVAALGSGTEANTSGLTDVASNAWYTAAVNWAVRTGVMEGVGGGAFEPDVALTREQLCQVMANAASKLRGVSVSGGAAALAKMPDAAQVSGWATPAVEWCLSAGVISGSLEDGVRYVRPLGTVTRAQMATVMVNAVTSGVFAK